MFAGSRIWAWGRRTMQMDAEGIAADGESLRKLQKLLEDALASINNQL